MPCNCGQGRASGKDTNVKYVVVSPTGRQQTYQTEIEARAALTRLGGGAIQKVPK